MTFIHIKESCCALDTILFVPRSSQSLVILFLTFIQALSCISIHSFWPFLWLVLALRFLLSMMGCTTFSPNVQSARTIPAGTFMLVPTTATLAMLRSISEDAARSTVCGFSSDQEDSLCYHIFMKINLWNNPPKPKARFSSILNNADKGKGYCGNTTDYCGANCQSAFGTCSPSTAPGGTCGPSNGGAICSANQCCSSKSSANFSKNQSFGAILISIISGWILRNHRRLLCRPRKLFVRIRSLRL